MNNIPRPKCLCGSVECGLAFIRAKNAYQCGTCINEAYTALAEISEITLDEDPLQGVRNRDSLRKQQDKALIALVEVVAELRKGVVNEE